LAPEGSERDVVVEFDGDIRFYPDVGEDIGDLEFRATFRKGKLREMARLVNDEWEPISL
jgi:hypothetical protein